MKRFLIGLTIIFTLCYSLSAGGTQESKTDTEKVTLNVMMSFPRFTEQMETYFDQFEKKMLLERGIEVEVILEMPSSGQYENILQTRLAANDAPDLFTLHASANLPTYQRSGYLADLSDQPLVDKLYPGVREAVSIDGKVYGVPLESMAWGYLYNKDIFEKCGLSVPDTIDEMKHVIEVLKSNGYTPFLLAFQEQWVPQLMTALSLGGKVSGHVPDWVDRMYNDAGSYEEVIDIFNIIDLIMENGTARAMETGSEQGAANFANGQAAMFVQGTWSAESILSVNPDIRIGVGALPITNDPATTMVNLATTTTLAVHSGTKNQEMAMALINYILDAEDSSALYESLRFNPVANVHDFEQFSWSEDASAYVAAGRSYRDLVLPQAVTDEQGKLLQLYYVNRFDPKDFVKEMDRTFAAANRARNQ
ncbi:ABC transporter substrate-binding protein [Spirochaeta dissipatitropha]